MRWNSSRPAGQDTPSNQLGSSPSASRWGGPSHAGHGDPETGHDLSAGNKTPGEAGQATICGVRRKVFFIVICSGLLIAVAAIAIGVGAGIAFNKTSSSNSRTIVNTSANMSCPDSHDTVIETPSKDHFHLTCGTDYPASAGADDLATEKAPSIGRCVETCAGRDGCMGVTWDAGECVLKKSVGTPVDAGGVILALRVRKPDGAA